MIILQWIKHLASHECVSKSEMRLAEPHSIGMLFCLESTPLVTYKCMGYFGTNGTSHQCTLKEAIFILQVVWSLSMVNISVAPRNSSQSITVIAQVNLKHHLFFLFIIKLHDLSKLYRRVIKTKKKTMNSSSIEFMLPRLKLLHGGFVVCIPTGRQIKPSIIILIHKFFFFNHCRKG